MGVAPGLRSLSRFGGVDSSHELYRFLSHSPSQQPTFAEGYGSHEMPLPQKESQLSPEGAMLERSE